MLHFSHQTLLNKLVFLLLWLCGKLRYNVVAFILKANANFSSVYHCMWVIPIILWHFKVLALFKKTGKNSDFLNFIFHFIKLRILCYNSFVQIPYMTQARCPRCYGTISSLLLSVLNVQWLSYFNCLMAKMSLSLLCKCIFERVLINKHYQRKESQCNFIKEILSKFGSVFFNYSILNIPCFIFHVIIH